MVLTFDAARPSGAMPSAGLIFRLISDHLFKLTLLEL